MPPPTAASTRRILYAGFATRQHSGGVHVLTQHVQLLRAAGEQAWLWLPDGAERPGWFDADVPVLFGDRVPVGADDLLVVPETPTVQGLDPAPGARTVIFDQNHFYTFAAGVPGDDFPGWVRPPAMWAVTAESRDVLAAALPHLPVALVPNIVDGDTFTPLPADRLRVCWFPRKRPREASLLRLLLRNDPRSAGVDLVEMVDLPRADVARTLGTATVFLALGHSESFGLPVAEALAAGCLVAGYDGGGGHELFDAPGAWRIPEQRPLLLRDTVFDLLARSGELAGVRAANREWVLERYTRERTAGALLAAVAEAFTRPGEATEATHPAAWLDTLGPQFTAWA
ncbi:glycosyltransferase [Nakamurella flavida]|uniref:Glycosyltransferase n=1 Tax=Nakamurella flavida TaxID=363630 RepID=A0A938YHL7_9ACTN|nr:glycosyltransferase [Nakamurella flavida]MBM9477845.1 glycosyltransferase [Nakamurella flavida]MDP9779399.1 glycosyltransferase involved in cell wall biosynthesis [Nakamurella flavida]